MAVLCDISFSVKMEERRSNGFRVKPSFGQVLGYIQEGEPLTLDLPNRKASIYTSSHFYLDDYPNAPEPLSDAPLPHTSINPAAAFETADEGYDGVPFPRPPREFTRPSFLPDSDDGGMDPGQALRNDGLNPPRPPTLGGRMRESGIQAAEAIVAGGAAGAAAAVRSVSENQTMLALRGGGDWLDRTLRIPRRPLGLAPPPDEVPAPQIIGRPSEVEPLLERAGQRAAEVERGGAGHRELRFPAAGGSGSIGGLRHCRGGGGGSGGGGSGRRRDAGSTGRAGCGRHRGRGDGRPGRGGSRGCPGRHGVGDRGRAQRGFAPHGLGCRNGRRHGLRRLAAEHDHGRADPEWHARKRRRGSLLHPGAAEGPAAGGLQDRHGVGERAQESAAAADPKPPGTASEAPGANPLRAEQRSHPGVLWQRTVPGQPPVPRRPPRAQPEASRASGNPAVLRGASSGERTGSCIAM